MTADGVFDANEFVRALKTARGGPTRRQERLEATRALESALAGDECILAYLEVESDAESVIEIALETGKTGSLTRSHLALLILKRIIPHAPRVARALVKSNAKQIWSLIVAPAAAPSSAVRRTATLTVDLLTQLVQSYGPAIARDVLLKFEWGLPRHAKALASPRLGVPEAISLMLVEILDCRDRELYSLVFGRKLQLLVISLLQSVVEVAGEFPSDFTVKLIASIHRVSRDKNALFPRLLATAKQIPELLFSIALIFPARDLTEAHRIVMEIVEDTDFTAPDTIMRLLYAPGSSTKLRPYQGPHLELFVDILAARPEILPQFLSGGIGHNEPSLSSAWLAVAALISEVLGFTPVSQIEGNEENLADLVAPMAFVEHGFLDKALVHEAQLVRFTGLLVYCRILERLETVSRGFEDDQVVDSCLRRLPSVGALLSIIRQDDDFSVSRALAAQIVTFFHRNGPRTIAQAQADMPKLAIPVLHELRGIGLGFARKRWKDLAHEVVRTAPVALLAGTNGHSISRFGQLLRLYLENSARDEELEDVLVDGMRGTDLFLHSTSWEARFWMVELWSLCHSNRSPQEVQPVALEVDRVLVDAYQKPFALVDSGNESDGVICSLFTTATLSRARRHATDSKSPGWANIQHILISIQQLYGPPCIPHFQHILGSEALPELQKCLLGDQRPPLSSEISSVYWKTESEVAIRAHLNALRHCPDAHQTLWDLTMLIESGVASERLVCMVIEEPVIQTLFDNPAAACAIICIIRQLLSQTLERTPITIEPYFDVIATIMRSTEPTEGLHLIKLLVEVPVPGDFAGRLLSICLETFKSQSTAVRTHAVDVSLSLLNNTQGLDPAFLFDFAVEVLLNRHSELNKLVASMFNTTGSLLVQASSSAVFCSMADDFIQRCFTEPCEDYSIRLGFLLKHMTCFHKSVAAWMYDFEMTDNEVHVGTTLSVEERRLFRAHLPVIESFCLTGTIFDRRRAKFLVSCCLVPLLELERHQELGDAVGIKLLRLCCEAIEEHDDLTAYFVSTWRKGRDPPSFMLRYSPAKFMGYPLLSKQKPDAQHFTQTRHRVGEIIRILKPKTVECRVKVAQFVLKKRLWLSAPLVFDRTLEALQSAPQLGNAVKGGVGKNPKRCRAYVQTALRQSRHRNGEAITVNLRAVRLLTKIVFKSCLPPSYLLGVLADRTPSFDLSLATAVEEFALLVVTVVKRADKEPDRPDLENMRIILQKIAKLYGGRNSSTDRSLRRAADVFLMFEERIRALDGDSPYTAFLALDPRTSLYQFDASSLRSTADGILNTKNVCLDPLVVVTSGYRLVSHALLEETTVVDLRRCVTSGMIGVALASLSSPNLQLRSMAYGFLEGYGQLLGNFVSEPGDLSVSAALFKDRRQALFLLLAFRDWLRQPLQQVSHISTTLLRLTIMVLMQPTHELFLTLTKLLVKRDFEWYMSGSLLVDLLKDVKGNRGEILFALRIVNLGCKTKQDLLLIRKRRILGLVVAVANNKHDANLARMAVDALLAVSRFSSGARELRRRHGVLQWIHETPVNERDIRLLFELHSNLSEQIFRDGEALEFGIPCRESLTQLLNRFSDSQVSKENPSAFSNIIFGAIQTAISLSPRKRHLLPLSKTAFLRMLAFAGCPSHELLLFAYAKVVDVKDIEHKTRENWAIQCMVALASAGAGTVHSFPSTQLDRDVILASVYEYLLSPTANATSELRSLIAQRFNAASQHSTPLLNSCGLLSLVRSGDRAIIAQLLQSDIRAILERCPTINPLVSENIALLEAEEVNDVHEKVARILPAMLLGLKNRAVIRKSRRKRPITGEEKMANKRRK